MRPRPVHLLIVAWLALPLACGGATGRGLPDAGADASEVGADAPDAVAADAEAREDRAEPGPDLPPDPGGSDAEGLDDVAEDVPPADALPEPLPVKIMSLNLRYGFADDGDDAWTPRKVIVTHFLTAERPDILGVQEGLIFQLEVVDAALPDHQRVGRDRTGTGFDEYSAVYFDATRFEPMADGTFWLSDTPDVVGSRFSDVQLFPRIVTWAHLRERATGTELIAFNTHVDTTDEDSVPQRSAALIVQKIREIAGGLPVVLTGDFNEPVGSPAYQILTGDLFWDDDTGALIDPFDTLGLPDEGSFHGFTGVASSDKRIDWILHSEGFTALEAVVSHYQEGGHYPSDHFPVWASLLLPTP